MAFSFKPCDGQYRAILDTSVRVQTLASGFKQKCPILDTNLILDTNV